MTNILRELWLYIQNGKSSAWKPTISVEMKQQGLTWSLFTYKDGSKEWRKVCDFCGGNCGQCGIMNIVGNVGFNLDRMIHNLENPK